MNFNTQIKGTGRYLPEKILSNQDLEKLVETDDQWIVERTGIRERRIASPVHATSDLGLIAAQEAIGASGLKPTDIELILFATCTGDYSLPNTASLLQAKLGAGTCGALDLNAACSGFLFACSVANQYIRTGMFKNILVVGAETLSRIVNYKDRDTCILFGDGAGAVVLGRADENSASAILGESLFADGNLAELLMLPGGGSKMPITKEVLESGAHHMIMKGRDIFKNATRTMSRCSTEVLLANKMTINDIQWVIPHQANQRIIEAIAKQLDISMDKIIMNLEKTGNTSSASVPIALDEAVRAGKVKRGDLILITVFGAGLTSGALLLRY
ncbi:MAG: beta-ketoacyl-ACP synthase III [Oligoflexia bacterium]|nr:beta-ketoacyl-ACP synthase III [Oligoflexia bacterium]